jgi:hypothetical protein
MPRKNKNIHKIGPREEAANEAALDQAAGVKPAREDSPPAVPTNSEAPKLKTDTREKLLYKLASEGFSDALFDTFTDRKELLDLTCMLGIRKLAVIVCCRDTEVADVKDAIASMRVVLNMVYGENASMDPNKFIAPPAAVETIPTGASEGADDSIDKMKRFGA